MPYNLTTMQSIFLNNKEITLIKHNNKTVYQKSSGPDYTEPFYVENVSDEDETLRIAKGNDSAPTLTIEYSTNRTTWQTLGTTSTTALARTLTPGEKVYLRCSTNAWGTKFFGVNNTISGVSKVGGNIMSLLYGDSFTGEERSFPSGSTHNFSNLFYNNNNLVNAKELLLPATTLANYCYGSMFSDCRALTAAPALPATTLADHCYASMFNGCSSLTQAPALPATTLASYCYRSMFSDCRALTAAPELPAATLVIYCYQNMFTNCSSLTQAPALPATTLASNCYNSMFRNCSSLTQAPELPAATLVIYCYQNMFNGCRALNNVTCLATSGINKNNSTTSWLISVSSLGTFTKAAGVEWPSGNNGIPSGWTVVEV